MATTSGTSLSLDGAWDLYWEDDFPQHLTDGPAVPGRRPLAAEVPEPVHQTLMRAGLLDDPRVGLNSLRARWVEEQYWVYRRSFATPEGLGEDTPAWLVFDLLEMDAVVWLNGERIGAHASAHRPARFDVTGRLRTDGTENLLVVRVESGLFSAADKPGAEYRQSPQALLTKPHWHRKGQWQRGWDWQSRLQNVGIMGSCRLEWSESPIIEQVTAYALPTEDLSNATVYVKVVVRNGGATPAKGWLYIRTWLPGDDPQGPGPAANVELTIPPGISEHRAEVKLNSPRLWWPVGHGEQNLYNVGVVLLRGDKQDDQGEDWRTVRVGVRKVEVDQSPHPVEGRYFTLKVNDRPIFCKGGNWVPADMLYSTVTAERTRELVDLALAANFNLLRIWGGGVWAGHDLLDYCDEKGVLVWHDLLFACSKYPGDHPEFAAEVRCEVTWAMREFAHHPSLVVWCGNNEIEEGDWHWGWQQQNRITQHYALFHRDLPRLAAEEDPSKFYWISSPYSPDYKSPRDPTVGDQHPWRVSIGDPGPADWWTYRTFVDRFPNEGGVLGASSPATLRQFLPENERYLLSPSWEHHDNPFARNGSKPGDLGRAYDTVRLWTGRDPLAMDWEEYAFVSALLQAEGLTEYISNYRRRMFSSAAAIFWMYNDSWPATHGWTIVDYYRRRKLAYHPVRRAFAPVTVVAADEGDGHIGFYAVNDTPEPFNGDVAYAWFYLDGSDEEYLGKSGFTVPANSSVRIDVLGPAKIDPTRGGYSVLLFDDHQMLVAQHRLFLRRFHELRFTREPQITLDLEGGLLTLTSDAFAWGVCLDVDGEAPLPDNCFDLLPGVPYTIPWDVAALGEPRVVRVGNGVVGE
jgi:beta-mannosidase